MALEYSWAETSKNKKQANARGKPRRSAKHGGHPQAELVGVGLTAELGW